MRSEPLKPQKAELRHRLKDIIAAVRDEDSAAWSRAVANRVSHLSEWRDAANVLLFRSMPAEIDTAALIDEARRSGKSVYLPRVSADAMTFHWWQGERLVAGPFGILEPAPDLPRFASGPSQTLVICPGLAFDENGNRLGRGKAYYDRFLAAVRVGAVRAVGICFECQLVQHVPVDPHDMKMDLVVTEKRVINPRA